MEDRFIQILEGRYSSQVTSNSPFVQCSALSKAAKWIDGQTRFGLGDLEYFKFQWPNQSATLEELEQIVENTKFAVCHSDSIVVAYPILKDK